MTRYLLDTNVLVYLHDGADHRRRHRARDVLVQVGAAQSAALTAQVLGEFASVALRKLQPPLHPSAVLKQVERLRRRFPVHPITSAVVEEALRGVQRHKLGLWDAQLWASARLHQIAVILSEDVHPGSLDGVSWVDPFDPDLDPAAL